MTIKERIKIVSFILKYVWRINPQFMKISVVSTLVNSFFPFLLVLLPMYIIDEISNQYKESRLVLLVAIICFSEGIYRYFSQKLELTRNLYNEKLMLNVQADLTLKYSQIEYQHLESARFFDLESNAIFPILRQNSLTKLFKELETNISSGIKIVGLVAVVSFFNIWMILFIVGTSLAYLWMHSRLAKVSIAFSEKLQPINRKFSYYIHMITDYKRAKEIRIYDTEPLISQKVGDYNIDTYKNMKEMSRKSGLYSSVGKFCSVLQKYVCYLYAVKSAYKGIISLGQLTMFITAIYQLSENILLIINNGIEFHRECEYIKRFYDFYNYCEEHVEIKKGDQNMPDKVEHIEFRNVWFRYPNCEEYIFKDLNLILEKGKKYAIVGINGAGKSTLVKLLLRFFEPERGVILVNGLSISEIDVNLYREEISAVFQDFFLLNESIEDNIMLGQKRNDEKLNSILESVNLQYLKTKLSNGYRTKIGKGFEECAVELSGGEKQRLAVARMIKKDSKIYVMDEPTAALDPEAEVEFYEQIKFLSSQKGDCFFVLISHRLSCTTFCDKIIVLDKGKLSQEGTHKELVNKEGLYKKMWEIQKSSLLRD